MGGVDWCSATESTNGLPVRVCLMKRPRTRAEKGPKNPGGSTVLARMAATNAEMPKATRRKLKSSASFSRQRLRITSVNCSTYAVHTSLARPGKGAAVAQPGHASSDSLHPISVPTHPDAAHLECAEDTKRAELL